MGLANEIKKIMIDCDITLTQLAQQISQAKGKHYTVQNLSQKFRNNTLNTKEIDIILKALNYKIFFYPNDTNAVR